MGTILELQRWLYSGAVDALNAMHTAGLTGLPALIGAAFGFCMLHALLPGHGKAVLASYYAGDGRFPGAFGSSIILILTHVGSAVVIVLCKSGSQRRLAPELFRRRLWNQDISRRGAGA